MAWHVHSKEKIKHSKIRNLHKNNYEFPGSDISRYNSERLPAPTKKRETTSESHLQQYIEENSDESSDEEQEIEIKLSIQSNEQGETRRSEQNDQHSGSQKSKIIQGKDTPT